MLRKRGERESFVFLCGTVKCILWRKVRQGESHCLLLSIEGVVFRSPTTEYL